MFSDPGHDVILLSGARYPTLPCRNSLCGRSKMVCVVTTQRGGTSVLTVCVRHHCGDREGYSNILAVVGNLTIGKPSLGEKIGEGVCSHHCLRGCLT